MIQYYIRQIDFFYSDEASYAVQGLMNLTDSFPTFAEANAKRWKLQQRIFQGMQLDDWDPISSINHRTPELEGRWLALNEYIKQEFTNGFFLELDDYATKQFGTSKYMPSRDYYLPGTLTIEQVKKLTELSGIEVYTVIEIDETNPPFFGIYRLGNYGQTEGWVKTLAVQASKSGYKEAKIPVTFTDKTALIAGNKELLYDTFQGLDIAQLNLPIAELTDTPTLLKAYVNSVRFGLKIDPPDRLKVDYAEGSLIGLNEFLRIKIFELRPLSLEMVLKYRGYQAMQ